MADSRPIPLGTLYVVSLLLALPAVYGVERGLLPVPPDPLAFAGAFFVGLGLLAFADPPLGPPSPALGALAISVPPALFAVGAHFLGGRFPALAVFFRFAALSVVCWALLVAAAVFLAERRSGGR